MAKTWIQSLTNRAIEPLALTPEMVGGIEEIAHSLAGEFRFTRQTRARYTVAQHCVLGSRLLPPAFAGAFLLHEGSEVYLPDVSGPMKPFVFVERENLRGDGSRQCSWSELERDHMRAVLQALGLGSLEPLIYSPEIKQMDLAMLTAEKEQLCGPEPEPWGLTVPAADVDLSHIWSPDRAESEFLQRYTELFNVQSR
jgi:hypothetical protein